MLLWTNLRNIRIFSSCAFFLACFEFLLYLSLSIYLYFPSLPLEVIYWLAFKVTLVTFSIHWCCWEVDYDIQSDFLLKHVSTKMHESVLSLQFCCSTWMLFTLPHHWLRSLIMLLTLGKQTFILFKAVINSLFKNVLVWCIDKS